MSRRRVRAPTPPELSQLGPAIVWLRNREVATERLADAFGTTANHIRVLDWRARRDPGILPDSDAVGLRIFEPGVRRDDGIGVESSARRVERLSQELESIGTRCRQTYNFSEALRMLASFRSQLGQPGSTDMVRLLARWHTHRAWFAVHSGFTRSATRAAAAARALYARVYRESGRASDLKAVADAALIGSHAFLYINEPVQTVALLKVFRDASEVAGNPIGSDYHRQLGTAYALLARQRSTLVADDAASRVLAQVPIVMRRVGEAHSDVQVAFASRHRHLLGAEPNVEACRELIEIATDFYGASSLESVIAANYCAACQLATDSGVQHDQATELLARTLPRTLPFPHQATVTTLLGVTARLRLTPTLRPLWVRQVSYLNAYRRY